MNPTSMQNPGEPRWEYRILWRYGALLLAGVGLLAMAFGAAGVSGTPISLTLLPLGFVSLVAGVVLPRIEGKFTAGPSGVSAEVMAVHRLDQARYVISGPALAPHESLSSAIDEAVPATTPERPKSRVTLGDVWDALDAAGLRPSQGALGTAYFSLQDGRLFGIPNRGFLDHALASDELVALLTSLGMHPTASGRYPMPPNATPEMRQPRGPKFVRTMGSSAGSPT
jgi:hypothetical protein